MDVEIDKAITVGGSNVEIGTALSEQARAALGKLASRYFGRITNAGVHFSREGINYRCSVTLQTGGVPMLSAEAQHKEPYAALNLAVTRLGKQLRRMKRALHDEKPGAGPKGMSEVTGRR